MAEISLSPSMTMTSALPTSLDERETWLLGNSAEQSSSYTHFLLSNADLQSSLTAISASTLTNDSVYNNDISTPKLSHDQTVTTNDSQTSDNTIRVSSSSSQSDSFPRMTISVDPNPSQITQSSIQSSVQNNSPVDKGHRSLESSVSWDPSSSSSSARMTFSDIQPSSTFQEPVSSSSPPPPPPPPVTITTTMPASTTVSSMVTDSPKKDMTVLFIALPVCFVIILVVVGASLYGFNIRKKKKRTIKRYHSRDLWLNPVSDISLQGMTSQTVSPPILDGDHRAAGSKSNTDSKGIRIFKVLYPFEAKLDSQISLQPDDVVSVTEQAENGWYRGEVLGRVGWFPSNYVEEIQPPSLLEVADEDTTAKKKSRVTSFLLKKKDKPTWERRPSKTRPRDDDDEDDDGSGGDDGDKGEVKTRKDPGVVAEVINMSDIGGITPVIDEIEGITKSAGKLFKAVFAYKAACNGEIGLNVGDIVRCYDRDRNGWMSGLNLKTNQEGWFPAVYVNEANEEDIPTEATPKPVTYDQLTANRNRDSNTEGIGIEHKALYTYSSTKPEDLSFSAGDTVVVYETLGNGWWLGCRGEAVGWFPGSYVELIDKSDDSSSNASSGLKNFSIFDDFDISSLKSDRSSGVILDDTSAKINKRESRSTLSADFKPARKAPAPPPGGKASPSGHKTPQGVETHTENKKQVEKPEPPVRSVKPKIVKVPKVSTKKLKHLSGAQTTELRPLPGRPTPTKSKNNAKYKKNLSKGNSFSNNSLDVNKGDKGETFSTNSPDTNEENSKTPQDTNTTGAKNNNLTDSKPPRYPSHSEHTDYKKDRNSANISLSSSDDILNTSHNSVGPKILNRISAHLLDEVKDSNNPTPKMSPKLRKVAPPVLPSFINGNEEEDDVKDENRNEFINSQSSSKKPPSPKSPPPKTLRDSDSALDEIPSHTKKTNLRIAVRSFKALEEGELSFEEGSFIMDINEESPRPGWCVGMLADGTTGLYPITHVGSSRSQLQTEL